MKPGYKTTEFWLTVAQQILTAAVAADVFPKTDNVTKWVAFAGSALSIVLYNVSRGKAKAQ